MNTVTTHINVRFMGHKSKEVCAPLPALPHLMLLIPVPLSLFVLASLRLR